MSEMGFGFPGSKAVPLGSHNSSFCEEAKILIHKLNASESSMSDLRQNQINNVIVELKKANIWNQLDFLYVWAAHSRGASLVDWKNPNTRTATVVGGMTFTANTCWQGNGSTGRIALGFNPGDGGTYNFQAKNNSFGIHVYQHVSETKADLGAWNSGSSGCDLLTNAGTFTQNSTNNSTTQQSISVYSGIGLSSNRRQQDKVWGISRNGYDDYGSLTIVQETDTTKCFNSIEWVEFCRRVGNTFSNFSSKKHTYSFAGSGNFDVFTLHNIIDQYYLNPLGLTPSKRLILNGNSITAASTLTQRIMSNGNYYDTVEILKRAISGTTTPQLQVDAPLKVFNKKKPWLAIEVYFFWELTNDMAANSSNVTTCYNNLVSMLTDIRTNYPKAKLLVPTMLPRQQGGGITNANRQNDLNLTDDTTLNGKIRNHLVADGYADLIVDVGSDIVSAASMGLYSLGVAGVGEKNLTYYNADEIHPTATGYNYLVDNYIYPAISTYI